MGLTIHYNLKFKGTAKEAEERIKAVKSFTRICSGMPGALPMFTQL